MNADTVHHIRFEGVEERLGVGIVCRASAPRLMLWRTPRVLSRSRKAGAAYSTPRSVWTISLRGCRRLYA